MSWNCPRAVRFVLVHWLTGSRPAEGQSSRMADGKPAKANHKRFRDDGLNLAEAPKSKKLHRTDPGSGPGR